MSTPKKKPSTETNLPAVGHIVRWTPREQRSEGPGPFPAIIVQLKPLVATAFLPGHTVQLGLADFDDLEF